MKTARFVRQSLKPLVLSASLLTSASAFAIVYGTVDFPDGAVSFADAVVSYDPAFGGGAEPTAVITVDGRQFVRLAGGRPMVAHAPQVIEYGGDEAVGSRIVENLAYVI